MNVTELYRELKMTKDEFFVLVQELGFDIGERAIKIDDAVAVKVIEAIKKKRKADRKERIFTDDAEETDKGEDGNTEATAEEGEILGLPEKISVKDFAERLDKRVTDLIAILMQNGIMATINESLDYETAAIIAEDLGYKPELKVDESDQEALDKRAEAVSDALKSEDKKSLKPRPPVVVIMGHVDHGKTTLLDTIRKTEVTEGESGGITQHIGAYQVHHKKKEITFIDTPGHEAFTAMRSRGAKIADIAILVVAADDGIKPQTVESIHILEEAGIPFVVAINKIDKPEADIDRVKKELSELNLIPEDYGGKTITVPISAKGNENIDDLLDTVLLVGDMEKDGISANPAGEALGTIIESHVDKNVGPVATVLVQNGTLKIGDIVQIGKVPGRIRALKDWNGDNLKTAGPSVPTQVLGLKKAPIVGDVLRVVKDKKVLKQAVKEYESFGFLKEKLKDEDEEGKKKLKIVLRADKLGSLEAIVQSLQAITHEEVGINIIQKGLGSVTENDIAIATAGGALVMGFHTNATAGAKKFAKDEGVNIYQYEVIYELIDQAKEDLEKLLDKKLTYKKIGSLKILAVFKRNEGHVVCGGRVEDGKMRVKLPVKIMRNEKMIGEGVLTELQKDKKKTSEVAKGSECGMRIDGDTDIEENDIIEAYEAEESDRKLEE